MEPDHRLRPEKQQDSNPKALMGCAYQGILISVSREANAKALTIIEVTVFCGAWGTECRTQVLAIAWWASL